MSKTLIGKEGWLFLQNDSAKELEVHCNNLCLVSEPLSRRFNTIKDKYFLTVFPNKSFLMRQYLPDNMNAQYRPAFIKFAEFLGDHLFDGYTILSCIDDKLTYYKTDTHINLVGAYIIYCEWVMRINKLFNLYIIPVNAKFEERVVSSLSELQRGLGDLTWESNCGKQVLGNITDTIYDSVSFEPIYMTYRIHNEGTIRTLDYMLNDKTVINNNKLLDWSIVSEFILYKHNLLATSKRVIIFYDSFLLSTLSLYLTMFKEVYAIKNVFSLRITELIKPDYIFEFRCERFLF